MVSKLQALRTCYLELQFDEGIVKISGQLCSGTLDFHPFYLCISILTFCFTLSLILRNYFKNLKIFLSNILV